MRSSEESSCIESGGEQSVRSYSASAAAATNTASDAHTHTHTHANHTRGITRTSHARVRLCAAMVCAWRQLHGLAEDRLRARCSFRLSQTRRRWFDSTMTVLLTHPFCQSSSTPLSSSVCLLLSSVSCRVHRDASVRFAARLSHSAPSEAKPAAAHRQQPSRTAPTSHRATHTRGGTQEERGHREE